MHAPTTTTTTTNGFTALLLLLLLLLTTTAHVAPTAAASSSSSLTLFPPWRASDWATSDDSVRGGASQSYLEILNSSSSSSSPSSSDTVARFYRTLDYEALGGSGFASQRTVDGWAGVDLSAYDRVVLEVSTATTTAGGGNSTTNNKTYSLNIKDTIPEMVNGVEQAGISWEYNFQVAGSATAGTETTYEQVEVLFEDLVPTYRGSVLNDTTPLNLAGIKRVNFMIRR